MSLFDIVRDKAAELFSGASDKVTEATGVELPGAETAGNVTDAATATGPEFTDTAQGLGDTAQDLGDTATTATTDFAGTATDTADDAVREVTDPPRPM